MTKQNKYQIPIDILKQSLDIAEKLLKDKKPLGKIRHITPDKSTNIAIEMTIEQIKGAIAGLKTEGIFK